MKLTRLTFFSFEIFSIKDLTKSPVSGSKDAVGSSKNNMDGSLINALAKLTLFFCPDESSPVFLFINSSNLSFSDKYFILSEINFTPYNFP